MDSNMASGANSSWTRTIGDVSSVTSQMTLPFPLLMPSLKALNETFMSREEIEKVLNEHYKTMVTVSNFSPLTQTILIIAFSVLIVVGTTGNGLVCYVVARNRHMRTPRNIFIINLAVSDLTLCLFTQPFNLMKVSLSVWKLGDFMCKLVAMFSGANVFVSTISITAIALDRFQVIVYPTKDSMKRVGTVVALLSIWLISLLMASPLLIFSVTQGVEPFPGVELYRVCVENPRLHYEKGAYSIASMIFQYIVPILIVSVAHARICNKLKYRMVNQNRTTQQRRLANNGGTCANSPFQKRRSAREAQRKRKTNTLLLMIAIVFACSWMPLNVFNIVADFDHQLLKRLDSNGLVFAVCHLLVLSSACSNPLLYGWLNENFRREFVAIFCSPCCRRLTTCCRCRALDAEGARTDVSSRSAGARVAVQANGRHLTLPTTTELHSSNMGLSAISSAED